MKIEKLLSKEQQDQIEQKIIEIEKETSAEVLPMIVESSTPVGHVKVILFLIFILISEFILQNFLKADSWAHSRYWELSFLILISCLLAYFFSKNHFVQRTLTSDQDELLQVNRRALLEFYNQSLHEKPNRNIVLFLFSLMERRIVVLTSPELKNTFTQKELDQIVKEFSEQNKKVNFSHGLISALQIAGNILKQKLPVNKNEIKKDETSNKIIIKN